MRRPYRCRQCGYNFLIQVNLEPVATVDGQTPPAQKCPKCGETT